MAKVFIRYSFIFDPAEMWENKNAFEGDLAAMFKARGMKADRITSANEEDNEVMIHIYKDEENG